MKETTKKLLFIFGEFIGQFLKYNIFLRLLNFLFERSNRIIVKSIVKFVPFPNKNYVWKIRLLNKKIIKTPVLDSDLKTRQFALSYQWHSPCINKIEKIIHDYYPIQVPWIDIGSNLGLRSLLALSDNRPVYFIEPNVELNRINQERCELNNFYNYHFYTCGASDKKGEIEFFIDKSSYNSTIEGYLLKKSVIITRKETIHIDTLDNIFAGQMDTLKGAYIKIDVEGHELNTLEGAKTFVNKVKPVILVEVNDKNEHFKAFLRMAKTWYYNVYELGNFKAKKILKKIDTNTGKFNSIKNNDFLLVNANDQKFLKVLKKHSV